MNSFAKDKNIWFPFQSECCATEIIVVGNHTVRLWNREQLQPNLTILFKKDLLSELNQLLNARSNEKLCNTILILDAI